MDLSANPGALLEANSATTSSGGQLSDFRYWRQVVYETDLWASMIMEESIKQSSNICHEDTRVANAWLVKVLFRLTEKCLCLIVDEGTRKEFRFSAALASAGLQYCHRGLQLLADSYIFDNITNARALQTRFRQLNSAFHHHCTSAGPLSWAGHRLARRTVEAWMSIQDSQRPEHSQPATTI